MSMRNVLYMLLVIFIIAVTGVGLYNLFQGQRLLRDMIESMKHEKRVDIVKESPVEPSVIEKIVTKSEVWRPIQTKIKNTVVQVFSQVAEVDLLQPYKTPTQHSAYGSGFFINDQGDLITNAHVINQAKSIWIQVSSLGKRIIDVDVVGVSPERDLALLRVTDEGLAIIRKELGSVPYLSLGDSDIVHRADEVMALGYPLGQQSLKSTTGVISGRESYFIQISAAINPGNSGGPLLNTQGEVVGVNTASVLNAQNIGYIIPINNLKSILSDLYKVKLLRKPFLGVLYNNASEALTEFLDNPQPGGCYVVEVVKNSTLNKAGVQCGDMIYEIDEHKIDIYGEMSVPWSEDKISIVNYVSRLSIGDDVRLIVYRKGERKEMTITFSQIELPAIHKVYPGYEEIDYEIVGGMVVMELTLNHLNLLIDHVPGLAKYVEMHHQTEPTLLVTHIFPTSQLYRTRSLAVGATINEVNGMQVGTLDDLRKALRNSAGSKFLTFKVSDNVARASDNIVIALPFDKVLAQEPQLSRDYKYPLTQTMKELIAAAQVSKQEALNKPAVDA